MTEKDSLLTSIHEYAYRRPRLRLEHPLAFCVPSGRIAGTSKDISEDGLLVQLAAPVEVGAHGRIQWRFGSCLVEIEALVAHTNLQETGLRFDFRTRDERHFVRALVRLLSTGPPRT